MNEHTIETLDGELKVAPCLSLGTALVLCNLCCLQSWSYPRGYAESEGPCSIRAPNQREREINK